MKELELRKHAKCSMCGKPFGHTGMPLFWRVTVERFGVDLNAVQRQDGLGALLGNSRLANVMGTDADMALPMMGALKLVVCEACATQNTCVAALAELEGIGE